VPPRGEAYLGAWVNPAHITHGSGGSSGAEFAQLGQVEGPIGRPLGILHLYTGFGAPAPVPQLARISGMGSIPLLDWGAGPAAQIVGGAEDSKISAYAGALKSYGKPVFLRYGWEMNLNPAKKAPPDQFVASWQRIYQTFQTVGATNVSFVWCPGVGKHNYAAYFPGTQYVDWIAADGYDRRGTGAAAFAQVFRGFYDEYAGMGKPMMVAETGAKSPDQAGYLQGIANVIPTRFPQFKAVVYFDAVGPDGSWDLVGSGLTAFEQLAKNPHFSFVV
jgi:hypothetical protein